MKHILPCNGKTLSRNARPTCTSGNNGTQMCARK